MGDRGIFEGVSKVGVGFMRLNPAKYKESGCQKILDDAINQGVNYFESAYFYNKGRCDFIVRDLLSPYARHTYNLVNKMPTGNYLDSGMLPQRIFSEQLCRYNTDYFDFYLIQAISKRHINLIKNTRVIEYLDSKKKSGQIKHFGFSFHDDPETLNLVLDMYDWEFVMIQLNWLDYFNGVAAGLVHILKERNIPFNAMCVTKGGLLQDTKRFPESVRRMTDKDMVEVAFSFNDVIGAKVQMQDLSDFYGVSKSVETLMTGKVFGKDGGVEHKSVLNRMAIEYRKQSLIPCTGCGYCEPHCPEKIPISDLFNHYNRVISNIPNNKKDLDAFVERGFTSLYYQKCRKCGMCMKNCPQGINIIKEITSTLFNYRY